MSNLEDVGQELAAMAAVAQALTPLDGRARNRVLRWVTEQCKDAATGTRPKQGAVITTPDGARTNRRPPVRPTESEPVDEGVA